MGRRERTSRSTGSGTRREKARKLVFVPRQIDLELVGIIGPAEGLPDSEAIESVFLDGDASLFALVESLHECECAVSRPGSRSFAGASSPRSRPLH
jgi:hypothetical protein